MCDTPKRYGATLEVYSDIRTNVAMLTVVIVAVAATTMVFTTPDVVRGFRTVPPMPFRWPVVGTLPDFLARGGVDRIREIYEAS